mmetsp:Transcript_14236/g.17196  ORF Transcript_14236/g.17196 Transcript_14236/m.17196 type:complete len:181 (-) Transcript_14236:181-723(-)
METIRRRSGRTPRCKTQSWYFHYTRKIILQPKEERRTWKDPIVASNYPLVILAAHFFSRDKIHATALASSAIASLLYHKSAERHWLWLDRSLASIAFFSSLLLLRPLIIYRRSPIIVVLLCLDIIFAFFALSFSNSDKSTRYSTATSASYNRWHTVWHSLIFFGQLLLLLNRVYPNSSRE